MNQEIINVKLCEVEGVDTLCFSIEMKDGTETLNANLNDVSGQQELKDIFAVLLQRLYENDVQLELEFDKGYSKGLYKEVCQEYIKDLNKEMKNVREEIVRLREE